MKKLFLSLTLIAGLFLATTTVALSAHAMNSSLSWHSLGKHMLYKATAALFTLGVGIALIKIAKQTFAKHKPQLPENKPEPKRSLQYYAQQHPLDYTYTNWMDFIKMGFGKKKCTINFAYLDSQTKNLSNAEREELCNKAAREAGSKNRKRIRQKDFVSALKLMNKNEAAHGMYA